MAIPVESPLCLLNDSTPRGTNWWEWSVWVEGPDEALDEVESVTYRLHPTFPQPVQNVTDRSDKFRLRSAGWGEFTVRAEAHLHTGRIIALERWLELRDEEGRRPSDSAGAGGRRPSVFISASTLDGELVADLAKALREQGIEARGEEDFVADVGDPASFIDRVLRESDGVVAVFSEPRSPWVESEFERARELRKPTFPVILGETHVPSGAIPTVRFELKARHNVEALANLIAARLKDKLIPDESESELLETVRRTLADPGEAEAHHGNRERRKADRAAVSRIRDLAADGLRGAIPVTPWSAGAGSARPSFDARRDTIDFAERLRRANAAFARRDVELAKELESVRQTGLEGIATPPDYETIVRRTGRPVLAVKSDEAGAATLSNAGSDVWRERLERAKPRIAPGIRAVGRIDVEGCDVSWLGTGWLVGEDVIVTNRHVARVFARGNGAKFVFRQAIGGGGPMRAQVDYLHEAGSAGSASFAIREVLHVEPDAGPDVAFLRVDGDGSRTRIVLAAERPQEDTEVAVIGYPARDSRVPDQDLMEGIFGDVYDCKRLAPGKVTGFDGSSILHDCSTLGGNSGSVVLDLATGEAVALHFSGTFLTANYAVPAADVRSLYERHVEGPKGNGPPVRAPQPPDEVQPAVAPRGDAQPAGEQEQVEEGRKEDYSSRGGYDEEFLGRQRRVPRPTVLDDGDVLRPLIDGRKQDVLKYQHFSVSMSKSRRMCHYSAVNIDGSKVRKAARGAWRLDPRIDKKYQIIHECYGNAPKFSRGHMTRREDPVWGAPEEANLGSDDSMHVTNVTPQMQSFNAPIWLGLENYALGHAREDGMKICVFTGPFFRDDDPVMYGVRIPRSFWKVIAFVHDQTKKLCVTGYTISQEGELPGNEFVFGPYSALTGAPAQVALSKIEHDARISFGPLTALDPMARVTEGLAEEEARPLRAFGDIVFF